MRIKKKTMLIVFENDAVKNKKRPHRFQNLSGSI